MNKLLTTVILALLAVVLFYGSSTASDLLRGEFSLYTSYEEGDGEEHPALETALELIFSRARWSDEFLVELDFSGNLKDEGNSNLEVGEAYYKYYGANYDLGVGQQRISWGTAVEFNPTDNLNPVNSQNLFSEKTPIPIVQGSYYLDNTYTLTGVVIPYHRPAIKTIEIQENIFTATPVADKWENTEYALKFSAKGVKGFDYSLSYLQGFEDIPTIGIKKTPQGPQPDPSNIYYRKYGVLGVDMATSVQGVGLWGEAAYFRPENSEDYYSAVLGGDYKFASGYYLEGQAIYQKDRMLSENTLIQMAFEKKLLDIHTLRTGLVYNPETDGVMLKPEVEFSINNGVALNINYQYLDGKILKTGIGGTQPIKKNRLNLNLSYSF